MKEQFNISFQPSGRGKARCPANLEYPEGKNIKTFDKKGCVAKLPYPAPECGIHIVECAHCNTRIGVTAAGRPDDPISVQINCKINNIQ